MILISDCFAKVWITHATSSWTSVQLKGWWDESCAEAWRQYQESDSSSEKWCNLRCITKHAKRKYFEEKIKHILSQNKRLWDLMSWVCAPKLDSSEAIVFKGKPCLTTEDIRNAFQETFNSAQLQPIYLGCLGQALAPKSKREWAPFSILEI